jgi:CheY-like chemotaxis protein
MILQSDGKAELALPEKQKNNYKSTCYDNNNNKVSINNNTNKSVESADAFKVLLVEDDKILQIANKRLLTEFGCHVDVAEDGQSALDKFSLEYDLVLMDIGLPDISGIEVTKQIRQQPNSTTVPIVALTAHCSKSDIPFCFDCGMNGYIAKPLCIDKVTDLIKQCLQYSSKSQPAQY